MSEQNEKPYDVDTVRDGVQMQGWLTSRSVRIAACVLISQLIMTGRPDEIKPENGTN